MGHRDAKNADRLGQRDKIKKALCDKVQCDKDTKFLDICGQTDTKFWTCVDRQTQNFWTCVDRQTQNLRENKNKKWVKEEK